MKLARLEDRPEIFFSVQGEGKSAGVPSVFVRASLCNLSCVWCDTEYTWNFRGTAFPHVRDGEPGYRKYDRDAELVTLDVAEVAERVLEFPCRNVVLTGGEPLLQDAELASLMALLRERDSAYRFEVETNGTLEPSVALDLAIDQYNVSPKLANSGVPVGRRLRAGPLGFFAASSKSTFKFVLASPGDVEEVLELVRGHAIAPAQVWLMPEGTSSEALRERSIWLLEVCKRHGFRLTDRLHVHWFGARRGV